jgi:hypothetical protein
LEYISQCRDSITFRLIQKRQAPFSNERLRHIQKIVQDEGSALLFTAIPAPLDSENNVDLPQKYGFVFDSLDWYYPDVQMYSLDDYDGQLTRNHFNNEGHHKYYEFLLPLVKDELAGGN